MGPKHILEDSTNLRESTKGWVYYWDDTRKWHAKSRVKYQKELERRMREYDRDREDKKILEMMKQDKETAYLHSDKIGRINIMDRGGYNNKMKEAIVKNA